VDITTFVIYFVCIFYSALGGLKAVLWTDAFQAMIMLASLTAIAAKGVSDLGGFGIVWERAKEHDRIDVLKYVNILAFMKLIHAITFVHR
jgi:sodium-coupled monocarboxylate transporter 8/12